MPFSSGETSINIAGNYANAKLLKSRFIMSDLPRVKGISFYFDAEFGKNKGKFTDVGSAMTFV